MSEGSARRGILPTSARSVAARLSPLGGGGGGLARRLRRAQPRGPVAQAVPRALARRGTAGARAGRGAQPGALRPRDARLGGGAARRGGVRLRPGPVPLHRLPPLRLRLRRGEQPVPGPADPLDPRAADGEGATGSTSITPTTYYNPETVPEEGKFYMPVQCQQCRNPPCVKVCPVGATWKEKDGIVVVDYNWCIGCRCCMAACPYGARRFNWGEPHAAARGAEPETRITSGNRPRPKGVVEKCTFCIQRTRQGPLSRVRGGLPRGRPQVRQPARSRERDPLHPGEQARLHLQGRARTRTRSSIYFYAEAWRPMT